MARKKVIKKEHSNGTVEYYENLFQDDKTGIYYWHEMIEYRHFRQSLKTTSLGKAKQELKKARARALVKKNGSSRRAKWSTLFQEAREIKQDKSKSIRDDLEAGIKRVGAYLEKHCPFVDEFSRKAESIWNSYVRAQSKKEMKEKGKVGSFFHDRKFLVYILRLGYKQGNLGTQYSASDFTIPVYESDRESKYLGDKEVEELLRTALNEMDNPRLYLRIKLGVAAGFRPEEALKLEVQEVNFKKKTFSLMANKIKTRTKRKMEPFIPEEDIPLLKLLCKEAKANGGTFLFPARANKGSYDYKSPMKDQRAQLRNLQELTGIEFIPKDLRKTHITNMVYAGVPEATIAAYCGNSVKMIRDIYDQVHPDLRDQVRQVMAGRFIVRRES